MATLQNKRDLTSLHELREAVQIGEVRSYGYPETSALCKELDYQVQDREAEGLPIDKKWLASLNDFLNKVKYFFQASSLMMHQTVLPPAPVIARPLIYVVDSDKKFLELLERIKEQFPIDVAVESDPSAAMESLKSHEFDPKAIVVSKKIPGSKLTGFDLIELKKNQQSSVPAVYALILEEDSIDARIEAMEKGINYIFRKPVSAAMLLKAMTNATERRSVPDRRVLLLDDDLDFCNFVSAVLAEVGINVEAIQDSSLLLKALEDYRPNILLLDVMLPKYDGLNLLKTLREDVTYNNLIIVIVTSNQETATRLRAYSENADDILFKPLDKVILQKRLLNLAKRYAAFEQLPYTGLDQLRVLLARLHEMLIKPPSSSKHLVLFEIDSFAEWAALKGQSAVNEVLVFISNQLQWETDNTTLCFPYESGNSPFFMKGLICKPLKQRYTHS